MLLLEWKKLQVFDSTTDVLIRAHDDEIQVINELRKTHPFQEQGRTMASYPKPVQSPLNHMNTQNHEKLDKGASV